MLRKAEKKFLAHFDSSLLKYDEIFTNVPFESISHVKILWIRSQIREIPEIHENIYTQKVLDLR